VNGYLALKKWTERRGPESGSKAKTRTGVPLTRQDFTPLPLRMMDHLWTNTVTGMTKKELQEGERPGKPRVLTISVSGTGTTVPWEVAFEFRYQNTELVYVKPTSESVSHLPTAAAAIQVVHVPPFSGIGSAETRFDRPYQDLLIGQGKAGDIIRNLLLEVHERKDGSWDALCRRVENVFGYRLLPPEYNGQPHIICQYHKSDPQPGRSSPKLDIASSGSGFHQVLLLLAFFYARPSTVLLLDEPDAHLHVVLQKQIYDMLRSLASERRSQLIVATHAEVLIDATSPEAILSFFRKPHRLVEHVERDEVREAIKRLTATDMLIAELSSGILYVEGESDFNLLRAWARVLAHRLSKWFSEFPFRHDNRGRNPAEAKGHFFALRALRADRRGVLLLDGDNRHIEDREVRADGLVVARWNRYESESYLLHPEALLRFVERHSIPLLVEPAR
jgi:predicted ATPase